MGTVEKDDGVRVLAASRRPDGSLRKLVRIRAGYTPQDEVALYQSKGSQFKQERNSVPPGYYPEDGASKPKTKAAKKNEKRKEKKQQATLAPSTSTGTPIAATSAVQQKATAAERSQEDANGIVQQMDALAVSPSTTFEGTASNKAEFEKRIRALRKKIRLSESTSSTNASQAAEKSERIKKLDIWKLELQGLEAHLSSS